MLFAEFIHYQLLSMAPPVDDDIQQLKMQIFQSVFTTLDPLLKNDFSSVHKTRFSVLHLESAQMLWKPKRRNLEHQPVLYSSILRYQIITTSCGRASFSFPISNLKINADMYIYTWDFNYFPKTLAG